MHLRIPMVDALQKYLDLTAQQMKLTAGNVANVDTPGYKTKGLDFDAEFSKALHGSGGEAAAGDVDGLVARPDGNNVSIDREGMQLAKEQLQFRMGVELMKGDFARTMSAIHSDSK